MNNQRHLGLTLPEVLIGMTVGMFVLMAALAILTQFLSSELQFRTSSQELAALSNAHSQISYHVHQATTATASFERLELIITDPDTGTDETVIFAKDGTSLTRNGAPITPPSVKVTTFDVLAKHRPDIPPLIEITMAVQSGNQPERVATHYLAIRANKGAP